jgi:hypothetical protein
MPHEDIADCRFEIGSGIAGVPLLAALRGPLDPAVSDALAASSPDLEHVFHRPPSSPARRGWLRGRCLATRSKSLN